MRQTRTDRVGAAGRLEMAPRLAPQAGIERGLGQRQMAFDIVGLLRRQAAHDADPLQRLGFARRLEIELGEVGMRRQRPAALQRLQAARLPSPALICSSASRLVTAMRSGARPNASRASASASAALPSRSAARLRSTSSSAFKRAALVLA